MTERPGTANERASCGSVHEGLEYWASRTPERAALIEGDRVLSYIDLLDLVRERSVHARKAIAGAAPGTFLPVLVDRSIEACISILACEWARVPYVPVDSSLPEAVVGHAVELTGGCASVLAHPGLADRPHSPPLSTLPHTIAEVDRNPSPTSQAGGSFDDEDQPALVVFTSGSTGRPKAVAFNWRARDERWRRRWSQPRLHSESSSTIALLPLDSSWGLDVIASVAVGYTVHLIDAARMHPTALWRAICDFRITHLDIPPQLLRLLSQAIRADSAAADHLEFLRIGSEPLRYEYLAGVRKHLAENLTVEHAYGASESGWIFTHRFRIGDAPSQGPVRLGRPIDPQRVRFVPLADGPDGECELLASGPIAYAYLHDVEQTRTRFETDDVGVRWWRTGDIVATDDRGDLWHRGRMDDVVKVRGRLASPSQVVAILTSIPGIRHAVVLPHKQEHNTRLVAHVELQPGSDLNREDVRRVLERSLPSHLVPSAILRHAALPTSPRGKIDRARLMEGPFEPW